MAVVPETEIVVNELPSRGKLTREEVEELAEATAQALLGVPAEEAFAMLDRGELEGTHAASALTSLRWLLSDFA
jgi:hypothetical protein